MVDFITRIHTSESKYELIFHSDNKSDFEAMESLARIIIDVRNEQMRKQENDG